MDEFRTFVSCCAALLIGRPLTHVELEGQNIILSPNHFLHGSLGGAVETKQIENPIKRWHQVHSLIQKFWKMYFEEYIPKIEKPKVESD